jgi:hypothetical protein
MTCSRVNFTFCKVLYRFVTQTGSSISIVMEYCFDEMLGNLSLSPVSDSSPNNTNTYLVGQESLQ